MSSLPIAHWQQRILRDAVYGQTIYGRYALRPFTGKETDLFVQYGFARHRGNEKVIDEPLAILAAIQSVDRKYSMFDWLRCDIENHATRRNGYEGYLAFYLRHVFEKPNKLDTIFSFRQDFAGLAWSQHKFELVTVVNAKSNEPQVSVVTPGSGPSPRVGFSPNLGEEVVEWLSLNKSHTPFCFPPEVLGPDLLFFVRSQESGELLLVMVQGKQHEKVTRETLMEGVRTVTPSWFYKSKTTQVCPFLYTGCICFN